MPGCPHGGSIRGRCFQHPGIPCAMPEVPMHNLIKFESPCAMPDGQPKGGKIHAQCQPFSQQKKRAAGRKPRRASGVAIWMAQNVLMSTIHARCESRSCTIASMKINSMRNARHPPELLKARPYRTMRNAKLSPKSQKQHSRKRQRGRRKMQKGHARCHGFFLRPCAMREGRLRVHQYVPTTIGPTEKTPVWP